MRDIYVVLVCQSFFENANDKGRGGRHETNNNKNLERKIGSSDGEFFPFYFLIYYLYFECTKMKIGKCERERHIHFDYIEQKEDKSTLVTDKETESLHTYIRLHIRTFYDPLLVHFADFRLDSSVYY